MRRTMLNLGSLTRARRRPSQLGPTPGPGRRHPPEAILEAGPGRPPRQAGMDRRPHRPEPELLAPGGQELGRPVQPRRLRGAPRAAPGRTAATPGPGTLPTATA